MPLKWKSGSPVSWKFPMPVLKTSRSSPLSPAYMWVRSKLHLCCQREIDLRYISGHLHSCCFFLFIWYINSVAALLEPCSVRGGFAVSGVYFMLCWQKALLLGRGTNFCRLSWHGRAPHPDSCPLPVAMFMWEQGVSGLGGACLCQDVWRALV